MTQTQQILDYPKQGNAITALEALQMFGCMRLGSRIWDIKRLGYIVNTEKKQVGEHKHVAEYSIVL